SHVAMEPARAKPGEEARLVADRFVFVAFLAPLIWLLWHRLWLEAFVLLAITVALGWLATVPGYEGLSGALGLLLSLLVALEGGALRIAALRRRGWREAAIIEAHGRREAELRYIAGIASASRPVIAAGPQEPVPPARPVA